MKGLTMFDPWATLVVLGEKRYESRSWSTSHRGLLAIHVSKTMLRGAQALYHQEPYLSALGGATPMTSDSGCIIGTVEVLACGRTQDVAMEVVPDERELAFGDWSDGGLCTCSRYSVRLDELGQVTPRVAFILMAMVFGFTIGAVLTNEIVGGVVGGVVALALSTLITWVLYGWRYWKPFKLWHEPRKAEQIKRIDLTNAVGPATPIQITLQINQRVHVERIRFNLTGGSNAPDIVSLYDWNTGEGLGNIPLHHNVATRKNQQNSWYWEFRSALLRTKGNTIMVGLLVNTKGVFSGMLEVQPTYEERRRMPANLKLPLFVA